MLVTLAREISTIFPGWWSTRRLFIWWHRVFSRVFLVQMGWIKVLVAVVGAEDGCKLRLLAKRMIFVVSESVSYSSGWKVVKWSQWCLFKVCCLVCTGGGNRRQQAVSFGYCGTVRRDGDPPLSIIWRTPKAKTRQNSEARVHTWSKWEEFPNNETNKQEEVRWMVSSCRASHQHGTH